MKLKYDFLIQTIDDTVFLVPVGTESFSGMIRSNNTAALIIEKLKQETSFDAIVDDICAKYNAPRNIIAEDIEKILNALRKIDALDE